MVKRLNLKFLKKLRPRIRHRVPPGTKPGTVTIEPGAHATSVRVMVYDKDRLDEQTIDDPQQEIPKLLEDWPVVWVDVIGLGTESTLRSIAQVFQLHPLALEDVVHVHQRAKVDSYDEHLYCVLRIPDCGKDQLTEQFSLFLGRNYVLTFQERPGDDFNLVRAGLRQDRSMTRQSVKPDYLAYRLIDAAIDGYFPVLESIGNKLDRLDDPDQAASGGPAFIDLHNVRRELLMLRRAIWPLRDAISELRSEVTPFVADTTRIYLRDCYDHAVQLIDVLESYRDIAGDVRDYYLSSISNRMNETIKKLTVISTIFLPLSFIAGVYGMNFNPEASPWNMPELNWWFGYPFSLALMSAVGLGMLYWFKTHGWLRGDSNWMARRDNDD
jgi:magnesium transporter